MSIKIQHIKKYNHELLKELCRLNDKTSSPNRKFFNDNKNILLIAFENKSIAGFLWAYVLIHPDRRKSAMFLYSIDVFQPFMRKGIATKLIDELKQMAEKLDCFEMFVFTEEANAAAKKLYRKTGRRKENFNDVMFVYKLD